MKKRLLVISLILSLILCFTCNNVLGTETDDSDVENETTESVDTEDTESESDGEDETSEESETDDEDTTTDEDDTTTENEDVTDETESTDTSDDTDSSESTEETTSDEEEVTEEEHEEDDLPLEEGTYEIYTKVATTKVIYVKSGSKSSGANVCIYERTNINAQKWVITSNGDGTYTIKNKNSGKVLDVTGAGKSSGTNVQQYTSNGTDAQKWYIEDLGNGYYYIISKCNGLYLDVSYAGTSNNTNIQVYKGNKSSAQKFQFVDATTVTGTKTIESGTYRIYSKVASNRVIAENSNSTSDSKKLTLTTVKDMANQKFKITYNNDGTYTIALMHSSKVMDVERSRRF